MPGLEHNEVPLECVVRLPSFVMMRDPLNEHGRRGWEGVDEVEAGGNKRGEVRAHGD